MKSDVKSVADAKKLVKEHPDTYKQAEWHDNQGKSHERDAFIYYGFDESDPPDWTALASEFKVNLAKKKGARYSMLLLVKAVANKPTQPGNATSPGGVSLQTGGQVAVQEERIMAVTAGSAWSYIKSEHLVRHFGKNVVLNWSPSDGLTELDTENPGERGKKTKQKLHNPGPVSDFAVFEDLFSVLKVGSRVMSGPKEESIVGGRSVRYRGDVNLGNLVKICDLLLEKYLDDSSRPKEFSDIERVVEIYDEAEVAKCKAEFFAELFGKGPIDVGFAQPQDPKDGHSFWLRYKDKDADKSYHYHPILDWDSVSMRKFLVAHINTDVKRATAQVCEQLETTGDDGTTKHKPVGTRPLLHYVSYVSMATSGKKWIISEDAYYQVAAELHDRLNERVRTIPKSSFVLPPFDKNLDLHLDARGNKVLSENDYNRRVCTSVHSSYTLFDVAECRKQIDRSRVEVCDIFSDGNFVAAKRGLDSAEVAYLCKQVADAATCLQYYDDYWTTLKTHLKVAFPFDPKTDWGKFTFVLALITDRSIASLDELPLKAKLAIVECMRPVLMGRFKLEFITVPVV